jgi:hypothetical protein
MRAIVLAAMGWVLIVCGTAYGDSLIGDASVPYSADRTVVWKGKSYTGKLFSVPGKQRHEQTINGVHLVAILRADQQTAYLILPDFRLYTAMSFPKAVTEYGGVRRLGKPTGTRTIGGQSANIFPIHTHGSDGSILDGTIWLTDDNMPMRIQGSYAEPGGTPHDLTLELSNVVKRPPDPALFELPHGMSSVKPEMVQSLFELRLPKIK